MQEKWSDEEHARFVEAIDKFGRDWAKIVAHIGSRTVAQVRCLSFDEPAFRGSRGGCMKRQVHSRCCWRICAVCNEKASAPPKAQRDQCRPEPPSTAPYEAQAQLGDEGRL